MPRKAQKSRTEIQSTNPLLSLAAMFHGEFSIDWLVELAKEKPSQILAAMEKGTQKGWLTRKAPGVFTFTDRKKRQTMLDHLDQSKQEKYHRGIADLLINELTDDEQKALAVADHLFHTTNDIEKCNLLMQAGDLKLKSFRYEEAVQCYNKVLEDLSGITDEASHGLFHLQALE